MTSLVVSAAREIELAALRPVAEVVTTLARIASEMAALPLHAKRCPEGNRAQLRAQIIGLRSVIAKLNRTMNRSSEIFRGYARQSGSSGGEYAPGGMAETSRDPAFITLSV